MFWEQNPVRSEHVALDSIRSQWAFLLLHWVSYVFHPKEKSTHKQTHKTKTIIISQSWTPFPQNTIPYFKTTNILTKQHIWYHTNNTIMPRWTTTTTSSWQDKRKLRPGEVLEVGKVNAILIIALFLSHSIARCFSLTHSILSPINYHTRSMSVCLSVCLAFCAMSTRCFFFCDCVEIQQHQQHKQQQQNPNHQHNQFFDDFALISMYTTYYIFCVNATSFTVTRSVIFNTTSKSATNNSPLPNSTRISNIEHWGIAKPISVIFFPPYIMCVFVNVVKYCLNYVNVLSLLVMLSLDNLTRMKSRLSKLLNIRNVLNRVVEFCESSQVI